MDTEKAPMKKPGEIEATNLGLQMYTPVTSPSSKTVTYDKLLAGLKSGKYKFTYSAKKPEQEIHSLLEKKN